jgi:hypothetical protein
MGYEPSIADEIVFFTWYKCGLHKRDGYTVEYGCESPFCSCSCWCWMDGWMGELVVGIGGVVVVVVGVGEASAG